MSKEVIASAIGIKKKAEYLIPKFDGQMARTMFEKRSTINWMESNILRLLRKVSQLGPEDYTYKGNGITTDWDQIDLFHTPHRCTIGILHTLEP
jgi:hypothetical protein